MAVIPQTIVKVGRCWGLLRDCTWRSTQLLAILLPLCTAAAGCISTTPWMSKREAMPFGTPTQAVVTWEPRVLVTNDTAQGGAPLPGIAGRLYLFDVECGCPLVNDGCVHAELFDVGCLAKGCQPVLLESWDIDSEKMKLLLRKDIIGWGYTIFLPWGTYSPTITQVQLKVSFKTREGATLYAPSSAMKLLDSNCPPPVVRESTIVPGAAAAQPASSPIQASAIQLLPPTK